MLCTIQKDFPIHSLLNYQKIIKGQRHDILASQVFLIKHLKLILIRVFLILELLQEICYPVRVLYLSSVSLTIKTKPRSPQYPSQYSKNLGQGHDSGLTFI
jgi:hypothetical protein